MRKNPYKEGGPCYLAYEAGYADAIRDAMEIMEETENDTAEKADQNQAQQGIFQLPACEIGHDGSRHGNVDNNPAQKIKILFFPDKLYFQGLFLHLQEKLLH